MSKSNFWNNFDDLMSIYHKYFWNTFDEMSKPNGLNNFEDFNGEHLMKFKHEIIIIHKRPKYRFKGY